MNWNIYLSGEIHTDWRNEIATGCEAAGLPVQFFSANTNHADSDDCASVILGEEENAFWRDHKAAKMNAVRTRTLMDKSDVVIVRFGDKYKQWNAAFDAGYAAASGKPLIVIHDPALTHALKEVDAAALVVTEKSGQVVEALRYIIQSELTR